MSVSESTARRAAKRLGWRVEKSRSRHLHLNNQGLYMLIDSYSNYAIDGWSYDADLDSIMHQIEKEESRRKAA
jgi:hypothetical protein